MGLFRFSLEAGAVCEAFLGAVQVFSEPFLRAFSRGAPTLPPQAASVKTEKAAQVIIRNSPADPSESCMQNPKKQPKDFALRKGANLSERK
ncbi:hypothetical protein HMPREF0322_04587, partial [Desulfitobacterium hafniense DP7]